MTEALRINGKAYSFDDLTLDEVEAIEEACGAPLEELDVRRARVIKVIVMTLMRRDDPGVTLEDVGALTVTSLGAKAPSRRARGSGNGAEQA